MSALRRVLVIAGLATAAVVQLGTSDTLGGFTQATGTNSQNSVRGSLLSASHSYGSTCSASLQASATLTGCPGSLYPATSTVTGASRSDTITNTGTTSATGTTASYRVTDCGAVQLANTGSATTGGVMLPRTGTTFGTTGPATGTGAITLDGAGGYASNVTRTSQPTGAGLGTATYGLGVWFKTSAAAVSPLFGFGSQATATVGISSDRILYLTATGQIAFVPTTSGTAMTSTATGYNDGAWHFAYVTLSLSALAYSYRVLVDGVQAVTGASGLLGSLTTYPGYWHLGWSPVAGTGRYFAGSLSGFTVDNSGSATAPSGKPAGYVSGTDQWRLDDSGGAYNGTAVSGIYSGTAFTQVTEPCANVTATWPLVSVSGVTLKALAAADAKSAAFPAPNATQASTITLTTSASAPTDYRGLLLYAPVRGDYTVTGSSGWTVSFAWSAAAPTGSVVIA